MVPPLLKLDPFRDHEADEFISERYFPMMLSLESYQPAAKPLRGLNVDIG